MDFKRASLHLKNAPSGHRWRELMCSGSMVFVYEHDKTPEHEERLFRHRFDSVAAARRFFDTRVGALRADGFEPQDLDAPQWAINPKGQRAYWSGKDYGAVFRGPKKWDPDVQIIELDGAGTGAVPASTRSAAPKIDRVLLRKLARSLRKPKATATYPQLVDAVNTWFASVVAAGLDLDTFRDVTDRAIITSKPYTAAQIRAVERDVGTLPRSYVDLLRAVGDVVIAGQRFGRAGTFPLVRQRGWPMAGTLASATKQLRVELAHRGGTAAQQRHWLRFAGDAPGAASYCYVMDLATRSEAAIHRVDDTSFPAEHTPRASIVGVKPWLLARIDELRRSTIAAAARR